MTIAKLTISKRKFVVIPQRDYKRLSQENGQLMEEEHALGLFAEKKLRAFRKNGAKGIPLEQVKKNLSL